MKSSRNQLTTKLVSNEFLKKLGAGYLACLTLGCTTPDKSVDAEGKPVVSHFVLEAGPVETSQEPLPNLHPIFVKVYSGEKLIEERLAYRAWDLDYDGSIDMIEYLDADGRITRRSYDFNKDGVIELDKKF